MNPSEIWISRSLSQCVGCSNQSKTLQLLILINVFVCCYDAIDELLFVSIHCLSSWMVLNHLIMRLLITLGFLNTNEWSKLHSVCGLLGLERGLGLVGMFHSLFNNRKREIILAVFCDNIDSTTTCTNFVHFQFWYIYDTKFKFLKLLKCSQSYKLVRIISY